MKTYREVLVSERLPPEGEPVFLFDLKGNMLVSRLSRGGYFDYPKLNELHPAAWFHKWLEEIKKEPESIIEKYIEKLHSFIDPTLFPDKPIEYRISRLSEYAAPLHLNKHPNRDS